MLPASSARIRIGRIASATKVLNLTVSSVNLQSGAGATEHLAMWVGAMTLNNVWDERARITAAIEFIEAMEVVVSNQEPEAMASKSTPRRMRWINPRTTMTEM
jgi:hypothetical protein